MITFFIIYFSLSTLNLNANAEYRRTCYFTNWAQYRDAPFKFTVDDINATLCTHIIYSFATMQENKISSVEWNDLDMYGQFANLRTKKPNIKLLLAIGGWNFDLKKMTYMLTNQTTRSEFVTSVISFLRLHKFDGLDLDFEYPGRFPSPATDRENFTQFVIEARTAFNSELLTSTNQRLLLTIAVPAIRSVLENGFEMDKISKNVDYITVMTYDYTNSLERVTGHNSPLYADSNIPNVQNNINDTLNYFVEKTVPPALINLGIPFYGRGFVLTNPVDFGLGASVRSASPGGLVTKEIGFMAYYEIQNLLVNNGTRIYRFCDIQTPFLVQSKLWIGYDDITSIDNKMGFIRKRNLGGWSVWALDLDDFKGTNGAAAYPLLKKLNQIGDPAFTSAPLVCENNTSLLTRTNIVPKTYRKTCYHTNWAQYRNEPYRFTVANIDPTLCTHVVFSFATLQGNLLSTTDYRDIPEYNRLNNLRIKKPDLKLLLAVGGWTFNLTKLTFMLTDKMTRGQFINSTVKYLRDFKFDGLDLDFEYPGRSPSLPGDREKFSLFVEEIRAFFNAEIVTPPAEKLLLTIALPALIYDIDNGFEVEKIFKNVDYITLMTYDYYSGTWSNKVGHNSALYGPINLPQTFDNINKTVEYMHSRGVPYSQMNLGIPFYGRGYILKNSSDYSFGAPSLGPNPKETFTAEIGFLSYYEVLKYVNDPATTIYRLCDVQVPFLVNSNLWLGYDDELSLENKMKYIVTNGLGGFSVWAIDLDDFRGTYGKFFPLLTKLNQIDEHAFLNNSLVCDNSSNSNTTRTTAELLPTTRSFVDKNNPDNKSASVQIGGLKLFITFVTITNYAI